MKIIRTRQTTDWEIEYLADVLHKFHSKGFNSSLSFKLKRGYYIVKVGGKRVYPGDYIIELETGVVIVLDITSYSEFSSYLKRFYL